MRVVTPLDLRRRLGEILDAASAGERVLIERNHHPVAVLVSPEDGRRLDDDPEARRARRMAALDRLAAIGERVATQPSGPTAAEAVRLERDRDG
ncbi:MAG TPA: type II toxin-antitoxin system Phd/YefM family antitoxin [Candidatus Limnocylindrales bacterium]|jgi:prevent-host-death family protein|nr:type II toxin-antitoxin system Phd/YefM family antitoxin [Candidatus Limnocylindrales bacterium]